jgi:L-lactate dehydrogenase (cytochrome)
MLTFGEVAEHSSAHSCWVIIHGRVYDVTQFLNSHPGGVKSILRWAGKDATEEYDPIHPAGAIERYLPRHCHLGPIDQSTLPAVISIPTKGPLQQQSDIMPLSTVMNLDGFEISAEKVINKRAWTYIHSAADGLGSFNTNKDDWAKISLRPRILRDVTRVDMSRIVMGYPSSLPFFIAPAAMAKLAHPDGELCLARGASHHDIPYCVSTYSSISHEELAAELKAYGGGHRGCLMFQLYVAHQKDQTLKLIAMARELGFKALAITVDTPVVGKREEDERYKAELDLEIGSGDSSDLPSASNIPLVTAAERTVLRGVHSTSLNWDDLPWIREAWGDAGPVLIKGVQSAEDAKRAHNIGLDGIYLSNHGGRQIDDGPSSIRTLLEIRRFCPEVLSSGMQIYLDGGCRRGTDIIKALALGATAVGMGRPFLYALGAYGTEGVIRAIQCEYLAIVTESILIVVIVLSDEIETTMRLLGVNSLSELNEDHINTMRLEMELPRRLSAFPSARRSKL